MREVETGGKRGVACIGEFGQQVTTMVDDDVVVAGDVLFSPSGMLPANRRELAREGGLAHHRIAMNVQYLNRLLQHWFKPLIHSHCMTQGQRG